MPIDEKTLARHLNPVFIETGAGVCNGSRLALKLGFPQIKVIEFDREIYERAVLRFHDHPEVEVIYGDSGVVLPEVIRGIRGPITFWLDSHGKSCDTTNNLALKPLLRELEAIAAHPDRGLHTVLIDDYDYIESKRLALHLTAKSVREALARINPRFRLSRVDGLPLANRDPCWLVLIAEPPEGQG